MPAAFAELVVVGSLPQFLCPVSGKPVIVYQEGFSGGPGHSPFLRFFIDWIGEIYVARPESVPGHQRQLQEKLIAVCAEEDFDSRNELVAALVALLPSSAFVLEVLDPPQGSFDGEICYMGFDFEGAGEEDTERSPVEMVLVYELG